MTSGNEAQARIKINSLLQESGWRFEATDIAPANIKVEAGVHFADLGDDLENAVSRTGAHGAIDFLLLDADKKPLVVLEAKRESIDPLSAKEQARAYAYAVGARFVILSNGNIHYFWDTHSGNPDPIIRFPSQAELTQHRQWDPNPDELVATKVDENYIVATQQPNFATDPDYLDDAKRPAFLKARGLKQLRGYQVEAIHSIQTAVGAGSQRFLFEMATGTGKTLVSAAVIKMFLQSGNARRVLFLVDRLELEEQAQKAFSQYLKNDYRSVVYKNRRNSWANAEIVVSTVQTFMAGNRYKREFSPTDFQLVISDEAHRSIGGNARAVFEYFVGYKLGLTATPKNYLRGFDSDDADNQREYERRLLIDTYRTFGCEPGSPTFSYDLERGSEDGFLIKPTVVDARTEVTTQLLSKEGYAARIVTEEGVGIEKRFSHRDFERRVFNDETNLAMCAALLDNGLQDPVAAALGVPLFGKTLVFAVSQRHAARLANILNKLAALRWPGMYSQSDFAMQVSSDVAGAQQMTINFANNSLGGKVPNPAGYESSKVRVAVTVGMMTTGYDCQDILNIALMRPVFSPSDFVQMKGRGTRKWTFEYTDYASIHEHREKEKFKLFDFFATCQYFENDFDYDQRIELPKVRAEQGSGSDDDLKLVLETLDLATSDKIASISETSEGVIMRIDREGFRSAVSEDVTANKHLAALWYNGDAAAAAQYAQEHVFGQPKHHLTLDQVTRIFGLDRKVTIREFLEYAFGDRDVFPTRQEMLETEWQRFMQIHGVDQQHYQAVKNFFMAFLADEEVRDIVRTKELGRFHHCATFDLADYQKLDEYTSIVPQYVYDYVPELIAV